MSGVKNLQQAEDKGLEQVTNEDLRAKGVASSQKPGESAQN